MKPMFEYKLEEQGIIKTRKMKVRCHKCKRDFHWGEYVLIISDEENSMLRILCRDIYCVCGERFLTIPAIFPTLEGAIKERAFCEKFKHNESIDWHKFWELMPILCEAA